MSRDEWKRMTVGVSKENERGVTLIELLVAMVIAVIIIAGVYQVYTQLDRQSTVQDQVTETQQAVRVAIDQITRELRSAGYRYNKPVAGVLGDVAATSITLDAASGRTVTIQGDYDNNDVIETISYKVQCLSGSPPCGNPWLMRSYQGGPFERFVANITGVTFNFYDDPSDDVDGDGNPSDPVNVNTPSTIGGSNVRRVTVTLTGRTDQPDPNFSENNGYRARTVTADVVLRNFEAEQGDVTPPACPTTLTAIATGQCGTIQVTWSWTGTDTDLNGFVIYYTTGGITAIPPTAPPPADNTDYGTINISDPNARSIILTGLKDLLQYNVIVEAYDESFNTSNCTIPVKSVIPASGDLPQAPAMLQTPEEEMANNQVTLRWNSVDRDVNGNAITVKGYRVYRDTTENFVPNDSINRLANEDAVTVTHHVDSQALDPANGAANCTTYYYRVKAVDTCGNVSGPSPEVSATPPDNKKAPGAPTITKAAAGDDDLTILLNWSPATVNPSPVAGYKIYYGNTPGGPYNGTSNVAGMNSPIAISDPATTHFEIRGLDKAKLYYIKIAAFDTTCGDETLSSEVVVTSNACSPRLFSPGGLYVFPGQSLFGTPHVQNDTIGLKSADGNQYVTWVADPVDCDPDSTNFTRQGFDLTPQPPNTTPNVTFKIAPYSPEGTPLPAVTADALYGSGPGGGKVGAPRNASGYYHFPTWPTLIDLDTTKFCNVKHDFIAVADDGDTGGIGISNVSTSTITLSVSNGGIELNPAVPVTTNISTSDDYHHRVRFGIKNTNPVKNLTIRKAQLRWNNLNAFLKELLVLDENNNVIGSATPFPPAPTGSLVTLSLVPTIPANGGVAKVDLTFSDSSGSSAISLSHEMRGLTISSADFTVGDPVDTNYACMAELSTEIAEGPVTDKAATYQNEPVGNTIPSTTPTTAAGSLVSHDLNVNISTVVNDTTGLSSYAVSPVTIHYAIGSFADTAGPPRPSVASSSASLNYPNLAPMTLQTVTGTNGSWVGGITAQNDKRIWYYLESFDNNGNFDRLPEKGAYTYAQCGNTPPSMSFVAPTPAEHTNVDGTVTIRVTASDAQAMGLQTIQFDVTGQIGILLTNMIEISPGVYEGSYPAGTGTLKHTVRVFGTDVCNNLTLISRGYDDLTCTVTMPSLAFVSPTPAEDTDVNGIVTIRVTASDAEGIQTVEFRVIGGGLNVPRTGMTEVSPGVYESTYDAGDKTKKHTVTVFATDTCGNENDIKMDLR